MPLARILTRNPERTTDLSSQLKQQGYSVEVARPDQTNLAAADLEIEFEVCERADVLDRAANLATELDADVAVAPGILQPAIQRADEISAKPLADNVVELPAAMQASPEVIDVPVMQHEPLPPVAFLDEPAAPQHTAMPEMPERYP